MEVDGLTELPSPDQLRHKILLKAKKSRRIVPPESASAAPPTNGADGAIEDVVDDDEDEQYQQEQEMQHVPVVDQPAVQDATIKVKQRPSAWTRTN